MYRTNDIPWTSPLPDGGSGVYLLTSPSGREYVGWTGAGFEDRWQGHCGAVRKGAKGKLYSAMRKYGPEAFTRQALGVFETFEEGLAFERAEIEQRGSIRRGLNVSEGGSGPWGPEWLAAIRHRSQDPAWLSAAGSAPAAPEHEAEACRAELHRCRGEDLPAITACRRARLLHPALNRIQFLETAAAEGFNRNVADGAYTERYIVTVLYPSIQPAPRQAIEAAIAMLPGFIEDERAYKLATAPVAGLKNRSPIAGGLRRLSLAFPDLQITPLARAIAAAGVCAFGLAESNIKKPRQIVRIAAELGVLPERPVSFYIAAE